MKIIILKIFTKIFNKDNLQNAIFQQIFLKDFYDENFEILFL